MTSSDARPADGKRWGRRIPESGSKVQYPLLAGMKKNKQYKEKKKKKKEQKKKKKEMYTSGGGPNSRTDGFAHAADHPPRYLEDTQPARDKNATDVFPASSRMLRVSTAEADQTISASQWPGCTSRRWHLG